MQQEIQNTSCTTGMVMLPRRLTVPGMPKNTESITSLYRAVGPDEFYDIMKTGEFNVIPNGLQAKQFGLSFEETLKFADKYSDIGAIIEVKVPTDVLNKIGDFTQVHKFIFKSGLPLTFCNCCRSCNYIRKRSNDQ